MTIAKNPHDGVARFMFNLDAKRYDPNAMMVVDRYYFNDTVKQLETAKRTERQYWFVLCLHFANILIRSKHPIEPQDEEACVYMVQEYLTAEKRRKAREYQRARGGGK